MCHLPFIELPKFVCAIGNDARFLVQKYVKNRRKNNVGNSTFNSTVSITNQKHSFLPEIHRNPEKNM